MAWGSKLETCAKHSFKAFKKHSKGLQFPNFPGKGEFALKVWEDLGKKHNSIIGLKPPQCMSLEEKGLDPCQLSY